jgi:hypothetical protein
VTDTVAVPPEVNKVPGCCAPSASWAAVHGPPAATGGVVAGPDGVACAVLAGAAGDGGLLGGALPAADEAVVTDGSAGPARREAEGPEQPAVSVTTTHATQAARLAAPSPPRMSSSLERLPA